MWRRQCRRTVDPHPLPTLVHRLGVRAVSRSEPAYTGNGRSAASLILLTGLPFFVIFATSKSGFSTLLVSTTQITSNGPYEPPQSLYIQSLMTNLQSTLINWSSSHLVATGLPVGVLWFPLFYDYSMATMAGIQLQDGYVD